MEEEVDVQNTTPQIFSTPIGVSYRKETEKSDGDNRAKNGKTVEEMSDDVKGASPQGDEQNEIPDLHSPVQIRKKVILVVEGEEYEADREILSKQTDYFDRMLNGEYIEAEQDRIVLREISPVDFRRIMSFMHDGRIWDEHHILTFPKENDRSKHLEPEDGYVDHIRDLWENCRLLLEMADMYFITAPFKNYLKNTLNNDLCESKENCLICITSVMHCKAELEQETPISMEYQKAVEWFQLAKEVDIYRPEILRIKCDLRLLYAIAERLNEQENYIAVKPHGLNRTGPLAIVSLSTIIKDSHFRVHADCLDLSSFVDDVGLLTALVELATARERFTADKLIYDSLFNTRFKNSDFMIFLKMHKIREVHLDYKTTFYHIFPFRLECAKLGIPITPDLARRRQRN